MGGGVKIFDLFKSFLIFLSAFPVNPITFFVYGALTLYGVLRIWKLHVLEGSLRVFTVFSSAASIMLMIVYTGEIIWWILYTFKFNVPLAVLAGYMQRNVIVVSLSVLCLYSTKIFPEHVDITKKTMLGFCMLGMYIAFFFGLIPLYADINWRNILQGNTSESIVVTSFLFPCAGKSIIAYIFHTMWKK